MPDKNLEKALLFLGNQAFWLKTWKLWPTNCNYVTVQYFLLNFAHVFYLLLAKKVCVGFFLFYLDLELFAKIEKTWFLHTRFSHFY